ncbi:MAG: hypothetical protein ACLRZZ_05425 [Enterocloster sp.]
MSVHGEAHRWGFGHPGFLLFRRGAQVPRKESLIDGICLNCTIYIELDVMILENGKYVEPELKALAEKLGK